MKSARFWAVFLLLSVTAVLVHLRGDVDKVPTSTPLEQFPSTIASWSSQDIPIPATALEILGKGVFLNRVYQPSTSVDTANPSASDFVGLFIGYFPTQRSGQSIHSPQNCLPGAGWIFEKQGVTEVAGSDGVKHQVGEYLISNGVNKQEVLYWYQSHGRSIANDYKAKFYMLRDAIVYNRTDAALVRVITPLQPGENQDDAHKRAVVFTQQITPLLPAYIPN